MNESLVPIKQINETMENSIVSDLFLRFKDLQKNEKTPLIHESLKDYLPEKGLTKTALLKINDLFFDVDDELNEYGEILLQDSDENDNDESAEELNEKYKKIHDASRKYLRRRIEEAIEQKQEEYNDDRFEIKNFDYLKDNLRDSIENVKKETDLEKVTVIFFDIDGLKRVNDMAVNSHIAGDLYLNKISRMFDSGKTAKWLVDAGYKIVTCHRSGDEFMVSLEGKESIVQKGNLKGINNEEIEDKIFIEYVQKQFETELKEINMDDVMDFSDPKQRDRYEADFQKNNLALPPDFHFQASMSGGWSSLADAFKELVKDKNDINNLDYKNLVKNLSNQLFKIADANMVINKTQNDQDRKSSQDEIAKINQIILKAPKREN